MCTSSVRTIRRRARCASRAARAFGVAVLGLQLVGFLASAPPAWTKPPGDEPPPLALRCVNDARGNVSTNPSTVPATEYRRNVSLTWNVHLPPGCAAVQAKLDGLRVAPSGTATVQAAYTRSFRLSIEMLGVRRALSTTTLTVALPQLVTIDANAMVPLLVQALATPGTHVRVLDDVQLDLSGRQDIDIAQGVTLSGGRTARTPGPLLSTTTSPKVLFRLVGDGVRIRGVRIRGADTSDISSDTSQCCIGIANQSAIDVIIENSEIFGWRNSGIEVTDDSGRIAHPENPDAVRIRGNFIHHNQKKGEQGYGVSVKAGAYALVERNVFDYNRHAIKSTGALVDGGRSGSGYLAYQNLVLPNGGIHKCVGPICDRTHQFDVHGTETCLPGHLNCGDAGEFFDISDNSFFYVASEAFKLRGTPLREARVHSNVFAHDVLFTTVRTLPGGRTTLVQGALAQTETGLNQFDNEVAVNGAQDLGVCDFDGDGTDDHFLATGRTWWFSSAKTMPWSYLNASRKRRSQVTLGYFDRDSRCDVSVDGIVYPGGSSTP